MQILFSSKKQIMKLFALFALICGLSLVAGESLWCGQVFDGTVVGTDQSVLPAHAAGAHWRGFSADEDSVSYSIAVVPADHAALGKFSSRCAREDVSAQWRSVGSSSSHQVPDRLDAGSYHVLVRATDKSTGEVLIAKSNGFNVERLISTPLDCDALSRACALANDPRPFDIGHTRGPAPGSLEALALLASPTVFNFAPGEPAAPSDDDNDDGYSPITQAGISIGVIVGTCVLVAVLLSIIFGRGEAGYGDTVVARAPAPTITHEYT